jgi:vacuolar iron transporter family protein
MALEHEHSESAIRQRLSVPPRASYMRDVVYGGIDGCVTTFAIVAGSAGAGLSSTILLILGCANLIADGISMAASNFSGTKSEREDGERLREIERKHIALAPEGEREEVRQIFAAKGFAGAELERVVGVICSDEAGWVKTMMVEEYGHTPTLRSPERAAAVTFLAFVACGLVPLLPYLAGMSSPAFAASAAMTGLTFFGIGCIKSRWRPAAWWRSGLETLLIGAGTAAAAFAIAAAIEALLTA